MEVDVIKSFSKVTKPFGKKYKKNSFLKEIVSTMSQKSGVLIKQTSLFRNLLDFFSLLKTEQKG